MLKVEKKKKKKNTVEGSFETYQNDKNFNWAHYLKLDITRLYWKVLYVC